MRRLVVAALAWLAIGTVGLNDVDPPAGAAGNAGLYTPISPFRAIDTRPGLTDAGQTVIVGTGAPAGALAAAVNITMVDNAGPGFLAAWSGVGTVPGTSVLNTPRPGDAIANFAIVPVAGDGSIGIYTSVTTGIIVDVLGYVTSDGGGGGSIPSGITARITGYGPGYSITTVSGDVTNGGAASVDVRVDMHCPNGTVEIDYVFDLPAGGTLGWSVICDGVFSSGDFVTTALV